MKMRFCEKCEEWVEPEDGKCPDCGFIFTRKKNYELEEDDDFEDIDEKEVDIVD